MKKNVFLTVALIALMTGVLSAQTYDSESDFKVTKEGNTIKITGYIGSKTVVNIPPRIQNLPVTSIGEDAFRDIGLTSVTIPNSVTSIETWAFGWCKSLTSVTIPNGVTSIGANVFRGCSSLTSVTIPNSVTSIGGWAFFNCTSLTAINVGSDNTAYTSENGVLYNKSKTTLVTYPGGKTGSSFIIPNSVTSIEVLAFASTSLTSVTIPNSVTSIGGSAFEATNLTSITIPNSVTSIGGRAFWGCSSLTRVTIPNSVTSIGNSAFEKCSGLASITIPNSVTSIGRYAFQQCKNLTSVTFQGTIPSTSDYSAFSGDLCFKFYATDKANGTPGTYTRPNGTSSTWTKK